MHRENAAFGVRFVISGIMSALLAGGFLLVGAGCTAPADGQDIGPQESGSLFSGNVARSRHEIIGGTVSTDDPAVAGLYISDGQSGGLCTGTLISPRIILTAAHCVDGIPQPGPNGNQIAVLFGNRMVESGADVIGVRRGVQFIQHPAWDTNDLGAGNDIAMILLDSKAPVQPFSMNRAPITQDMLSRPPEDRLLRLVGFGMTNTAADNSAPVKRQVYTTISDLTSNLVGYGDQFANACSGDSGGPAFLDFGAGERLTGITSFGDPDCKMFGYSTRVDAYASNFVDPWVAANDDVDCGKDGGCAADCEQPDPDCPCATDGFCTAACIDNSSDSDCPAGCGADGNCVATCPNDPDCGASPNPCPADGTCNADCIMRDLDCPKAETGDPCNIAADCTSGICLPAPDDPKVKFCTGYCEPDTQGSCPAGLECVPSSDDKHVCIYPDHTPGASGAECGVPSECQSGLCLENSGDKFCSAYCSDSDPCAKGLDCVASTGAANVCVPGESGGGGCAISATSDQSPARATWLLLVGVALFFVRRRRVN